MGRRGVPGRKLLNFQRVERRMSTFDEREKAYEKKFVRDQELQFRAKALRNKAFAQWAARKLGLTGAEADDYAGFLIKNEIRHPGDHQLTGRVFDDLTAAGMRIERAAVEAMLTDFAAEALRKVKTEVQA
jgi:hypothetical protein